jgi:uncharacterized membrane protein YedE/YeeE
MIQRKRRHPFLGLFFGLLLGIGLGLMAIIYGWYFLGAITPWIFVVAGIVIGLLVVFLPRPWGRKPPPATAS